MPGTGATNAKGVLTWPITFTVPLTATSGSYWVGAMDSTSGYPVRWPYEVKSSVPSGPGALAAREVRGS